MSYGPVKPWKVENKTNPFKKTLILSCVLTITGFIFTVSYYNRFSSSFEFHQYKFRKFLNLNNSQVQFNASLAGVFVFQKQSQVLAESENKETDSQELEENSTIYSTNVVKDGIAQISWNDTRLDILHMPRLQFDKRFKNPCWFEALNSWRPYKNNTVKLYSPSAKKTLEKLTDIWKTLFEEDSQPYRLRCLPYFMIIGQPKCGSTDLFWKVVKHPDIEHPPIKELHWWTRSRQGRRFSYRKIIPFHDYIDMFDRSALEILGRWKNISELGQNEDIDSTKHQIITGEASVSLFWDNNDWNKFPENSNQSEALYVIPHYIHHIIPDVKLILMFREPADRMYSDYLYFRSDNKSADDFHESVVHAIELYENCVRTRSLRACVYDKSLSYKVRVRLRVGMYSVYLKDWFSVFSKTQFLIFRLEDYSRSQIEHLRQIYSFLGQRPLSEEEENSLFEDTKSNVRKLSDQRLGDMHNKTKQLLQNFYRPYNEELATMLEDTRFLWAEQKI